MDFLVYIAKNKIADVPLAQIVSSTRIRRGKRRGFYEGIGKYERKDNLLTILI